MIRKILLPLFAAILFWKAHACAAELRAWEVWDNCVLAADKYFDGDSFHVKHGSASAILRLYFVDAPETDDGYGARIAEQAAYFRTTPAAVLLGGAKAKELTAKFLAEPFRVITRRQVAPGASRSERYYGIVESGARRLDAALVTAGLARASGAMADYPDATAAQRAMLDLRALEAQAAKARRGLWLRTGFIESMKDVLHRPATPARRINLNNATAAELAALTGIGPKMAEQIIRARPLKDLAALDALPGFGPKKIGALRELVSF